MAAKEKRAQVQILLRNTYNAAVVSITVNMPGAVKYTPDSARLLCHAVASYREAALVAGFRIHEERIFHNATGPEGIIAISAEAPALKEIGISLEDGTEYGRLFDIDVFDAEGRQISRDGLKLPPRRCMVCSGVAVVCIRSRAHATEAVAAAVEKLLVSFRAKQTVSWSPAVKRIGTLALEAILMEAACTPAPGLVDRDNPGAHQDMDFFTFIKSSSAVSITLFRCAAAGWNHAGSPSDLLPELRRIGCEGESAMLEATEGVNTQKGLIFLLGILAAAAALAAKSGKDGRIDTILDNAAAICAGLVKRELEPLRTNIPDRSLTAGERLYLNHGVTGIRGEIEDCLPAVRRKGIPCLREALAAGLDINDSLVHALLGIMTEAEDTTVINRHGLAVLAEVRQAAKKVLDSGGMLSPDGRKHVKQMDEDFILRNISPGGSADLLAATYFLHSISGDSLPNAKDHS